MPMLAQCRRQDCTVLQTYERDTNHQEMDQMAAFYTLLYVAPVEDAEAIAADVNEDAMDRYPSAWLRHIGDEELVALWDILDRESNEGTVMGDLAYASPDGEIMVMSVPKDFVVAVDNVAPVDLERVAQEWRTSELMGQWSLTDVLTVLGELKAICKRSVESGLPVLQVASI